MSSSTLLWPGRARLLLGPALLGAGLALAPGPALAEEPRAAQDLATPPVLVLIVSGSAASPLEARAATLIAAHLRPSGVTLQIVQHPASSVDVATRVAASRAFARERSARGVLWLEVKPDEELVLYLLEREGDRVFRRAIPAPRGQTSAALEALANVAGSAATELLEGHVLGMIPVEVPGAAEADAPALQAQAAAEPASPPSPQPEATSPAPEPARPLAPRSPAPARAEPARWHRLLLSAGYVGGTLGEPASWSSAVSLSASWVPAPSVHVGLGYDLSFSQHVRAPSSPVNLDLVRHPAFADGGYRFGFGDGRWDLELGARATVDVVERNPRAEEGVVTPPTSKPLREEIDVLVSLAPTAGLGFHLSDDLRVGLWAGMDVPLNRLSTTGTAKLDMQTAPVRLLGGLALQLGLINPEISRPRAASR